MRPSKAALSLALALALAAPVAAQQQAATSTAAPQQQAGAGRYDQQIQQDVQKFLRDDDKFKNVQASVDDGIVTLTGDVKLFADKARAGEKIRGRDHVAGVRNNINISSQASDAKLQDDISNKLRYDRIDQGQIFNDFALGVHNGVVTVAGATRTPADKSSALSIIQNTAGVKDVIDEIKVAPPSPMDDQIRVQAARAIYGGLGPEYSSDPQAPIRIVVDHGNVGLYGYVNSPVDKTKALNAARSLPGVFSVQDHLAVANGGSESAAK